MRRNHSADNTPILHADESTWREVVQTHTPWLFRLIGRFFHDRQAVEDLAQETFLRAFRYRKSYRNEVPLKHWLARIAIRLCYDALKKRKDLKELSLSDMNPGALNELEIRLSCENQGENVNPETSLITTDLLEMSLAQLSEKDRMILILREVEGLTSKEVAKSLGLTTAGVKMRIYRARRSVLRKLNSIREIEPKKRDARQGGWNEAT